MSFTTKTWDLLIIGAGACGLSAAINAASEGLSTLVVDRNSLAGGLIGTTSLIENYPGFPDGIEGRSLTNRFVEQAMKFGAEILLNTTVHCITKRTKYCYVVLETLGQELVEVQAKSIILASGRNHKKLGLSNEEHLVAISKLTYGHPQTHIPHKGTIGIVGGGNSAGQAATWLTEQGCKVILIAPHLKTMSQYLRDRILSSDKVKVLVGKVHHIQETPSDVLITYIDEHTKYKHSSVDSIYSLIGLEVEDTFKDMKNEEGFLVDCIPGIFVAGDCRFQSEKRCTAAVGEGVKAVTEVHKYLQTI